LLLGELLVGKRDISTDSFQQALDILKAKEEWITATMASISENHPDFPKLKQLAICAVTRLQAVAEEGYRKKVFDKPFWMDSSQNKDDEGSDKVRHIYATRAPYTSM